MAVNDGEFRRAQSDFLTFITELSSLVSEKDFTIPELPSKDIVSDWQAIACTDTKYPA